MNKKNRTKKIISLVKNRKELLEELTRLRQEKDKKEVTKNKEKI